jgi:rsbT co-antagonist protein RsbR
MTEDTRIVSVQVDRLSRLKRAAVLASEGAFSDAIRLLDSPLKDEFSEVEGILRTLIYEYKVSVEHSEVVIEDFRVSRQELQQKLETIERQRKALQELAAPIIDVWDYIITVPLTGVLDSGRAQELTERLLARIHQASTAWVILDLTGIDVVDSTIADHLVKLTSAARLMGAECLLTGVGPRMAQAFVSLETSLEGIRSLASLKAGLQYCLSRIAAKSPGKQ